MWGEYHRPIMFARRAAPDNLAGGAETAAGAQWVILCGS